MVVAEFEEAIKIAKRDAGVRENIILGRLTSIKFDYENNWFEFICNGNVPAELSDHFIVSVSHDAIVG